MLMCHFIRSDATGDHLQFIVPSSLSNEVLHHVHDLLLGGHLGQKKPERQPPKVPTFVVLEKIVIIGSLNVMKSAKVKHHPRKPHASLGEMPVGTPLGRLSTDILGPSPESTQGNKYVLGVTDYFTQCAIPDQSAVTCARVILNEVITRFGCPYDIHSDPGCNYESAIFSELCHLLEI